MIPVRRLLDCLGRGSLVRLIRERGLVRSLENEERRKTLAHSYHGDVEALVGDLNRQELVHLFRQLTFEVGGTPMYLPSPGKYSLDDLRAFGIRAFAGRRVRVAGEFLPAIDFEAEVDEDDDGDEDEDEDDDGTPREASLLGRLGRTVGRFFRLSQPAADERDEQEEEDVEHEGAADDHEDLSSALELEEDEDLSSALQSDDEPATATLPRALRRVTEAWSRPREIPRLLLDSGDEVPQRLRAPRFQALLEWLREWGVEACLADDPTCTPFLSDADSPGIHAKLRLRLAQGDQGGQASPVPQVESGPPIVLQTGERPVTQSAPRPTDYRLAILRLRFLTAVPSVERQRMPGWPSAYLEAATRGLTLRPEEVKLLGTVSAGYVFGDHSPYDAIPQLEQVLSAEEWQGLIRDLHALNPFQLDVVRAIAEQVTPIADSRSEPVRRPAPPASPADLHALPPPEHKPVPLAAAGHREPSPPKPASSTTNVRDLGALGDMFDDE